MLYAYSDATVKGTSGVATTILMTEDTFINCFSRYYEGVSSSVEIELLGVVQTMDYIAHECPDESRIVLFMDNKSIAVKYIRALATWSIPNDHDHKPLYEKLLKFSEGFNVNIQHIRGHQHTHNPNKVCDILSKVNLWQTQR